MDRPQFEVADVFRCYGADYRLQNGASMSNAQHRVMTAIEVCRTAVLGGHLEQCDQCGHQRNAFNSCANRHCPKCQSLARAQWLQDRQAELLNTQYFHVVFTVPEQIATISYQNKRELFGILFRAAAEALRTIQMLLGHRSLATTAKYLCLAATKVCSTKSPLDLQPPLIGAEQKSPHDS